MPRFNEPIDQQQLRDVVVIALDLQDWQQPYTAHRKLDVLVLEGKAPAARRLEFEDRKLSRLSDRDYGQELASRAFSQAEKFGAQ